LSDVFAMLDECARGYSADPKTHKIWIRFGGQTFHLPTGERGTRRPEVYVGKVRSMVRLFGIKPCADQFIPGL
jgi:hypothetical protein